MNFRIQSSRWPRSFIERMVVDLSIVVVVLVVRSVFWGDFHCYLNTFEQLMMLVFLVAYLGCGS